MGATVGSVDQPVGSDQNPPSRHPTVGRPVKCAVSQLIAAFIVLINMALLPLFRIGTVQRSGFGAVRSAVRVGLASLPFRGLAVLVTVLVVLTLLVPVGFLALMLTVLRERRRVSFLISTAFSVVSVGWCVIAAMVSDRLQPGVWVISTASVMLVGLSVRASRSGSAPANVVSVNVASASVRGDPLRRAVGLLVVLGGSCVVGLVVWFGGGLRGGEAKPGVAVEHFVGALQAGDTLRVLELLDPVERRVVVGEGPAVFHELRRLRVLGRSTLVGADAPRVAASVGDSTRIADDLASVPVTGALRVPRAITRSLGDSFAAAVRKPGALVAVRRDGRWYVSLLFSVAERRRVVLDAAIPAQVIEPAGAPNPEGAVQRFLTAVSDVDLPTMVALTDPDEASVLYRYGLLEQPSFDRLASWSTTNARWSFPDVGLATTVEGDRAIVQVTRLSAQLDLPSDLGIGSSAVLNGGCLRVTVERETARHCGAEIPQVVAELFGATAPDLGDLGWLSEPESLGEIIVVNRRGEWFVAPMSTVAASTAARLRAYDTADFQGRGRDLASRVDQLKENPLWQLIGDLLAS